MKDTMALQNVFFRNPSFGVRRSNNQMFREVLTTTAAKIFVNALSKNIFSKLGCDYCFWTIHFRNRQQFLSGGQARPGISTNTDNNLQHGVDSNLVCLFKNRWSQCPREIIRSVSRYLECSYF